MKNCWGCSFDDRDTEGIARPARTHKPIHGIYYSDGKWCEECLKYGIYSWLDVIDGSGKNVVYEKCKGCIKRQGIHGII